MPGMMNFGFKKISVRGSTSMVPMSLTVSLWGAGKMSWKSAAPSVLPDVYCCIASKLRKKVTDVPVENFFCTVAVARCYSYMSIEDHV